MIVKVLGKMKIRVCGINESRFPVDAFGFYDGIGVLDFDGLGVGKGIVRGEKGLQKGLNERVGLGFRKQGRRLACDGSNGCRVWQKGLDSGVSGGV